MPHELLRTCDMHTKHLLIAHEDPMIKQYEKKTVLWKEKQFNLVS